MHDKITNVSVSFKGIKKRARKSSFHIERLDRIYSESHQVLTPEDLNRYEWKAWELINTLGYKGVTAGVITVNYGYSDGHIESVELLPKQERLIARGKYELFS